ncbi:MAG: hypothetical protein JSS86_08620 [Cyanobacteria bacterium SZAS LIN-2]|nr:hypothetical protein [Cyanobacteria bacterium SZAS LIN-3]MBS1996358.1 hypothetical protein [Cyanobacteria bacterium SZAS LIN-2]
MQEHILNKLLTEDGRFAPLCFDAVATLYRARMRGSFIASLINGVEEEISFWAPPGKNRYSELLRRLGQLTGHESASWFYVIDGDESALTGQRSDLLWVRRARFEDKADYSEVPLASFETEPAPTGGAAYLGLMGESCRWLLLHSHYQELEFEVSIHGQTKLCDDLCRLVRPSEVLAPGELDENS